MNIGIRDKFFMVTENNMIFWEKVNNNKWEQDTFNIFERFLDRDTVYFDIGAWIGPTVLYAAQLSKIAFAFEPDLVAFSELKTNLELNSDTDWYPKVTLINKAAGSENGFINIGSTSGGGDSLSSVLFNNSEISWRVETISVVDFIRDNNLKEEKLFFKIDIEGGEYELIPVLREMFAGNNTLLFLSFHPGNLFDSMVKETPGITGRIRCWMKIQNTHFNIINSLRYKFRYLQSGRKLNLLNLLYYTLRLRSFSIVASNHKWS